MAVTPVGNPYVESSDRVSDYPGASEALAERIDIVGVNPFADSAARATAIPSPVEGQMASLNDDDKVYRYSGSSWVAVGLPPGLNPVAPTSIANSGGSASTTGITTTFTGVTSLSLNGIFSATYRNYLMICNYSSSSDVYTEFRLRSSGTDATGSNYDRQLIQAYGGSLNASSNIDVSSWRFGWGLSTARSLVQSLVSNPFLAVATNITHIYTTQSEIGTNGGDHDLATSYDGFTIYPISGNFTGTIQVFGYKD